MRIYLLYYVCFIIPWFNYTIESCPKMYQMINNEFYHLKTYLSFNMFFVICVQLFQYVLETPGESFLLLALLPLVNKLWKKLPWVRNIRAMPTTYHFSKLQLYDTLKCVVKKSKKQNLPEMYAQNKMYSITFCFIHRSNKNTIYRKQIL